MLQFQNLDKFVQIYQLVVGQHCAQHFHQPLLNLLNLLFCLDEFSALDQIRHKLIATDQVESKHISHPLITF